MLPTKKITVDSVKVSHVDEGKGDVVVLLPGFPENLQGWRRNVPELAKHFRVITLDLVGSGRTDHVDWDFTCPSLAKFLKDFLDALGIDKIYLVGTDTGASVALTFAADYPERVRKMVIFSGTTYPKSVCAPEVNLMMLPVVGDLGFSWCGHLVLGTVMRMAYHRPERLDREIMAEYKECFSTVKSRSLAVKLLLSLEKTLSYPLGSLQKRCPPTLILWAEHERFFYKWVPKKLEEDLPGSQLEVVPDTGHFIQEEQPEFFNARILAFFGKD